MAPPSGNEAHADGRSGAASPHDGGPPLAGEASPAESRGAGELPLAGEESLAGSRDGREAAPPGKETSAEIPKDGGLPIPWGQASDYEILQHIGAGTQADIFRAVHRASNATVAIKSFAFFVNMSDIVKEVKILTHLAGGPGIVKLFDIVEDEVLGPCLVLQLVNGCKVKFDTDWQIRRFAYRLLAALNHTHSKGVVHADLHRRNTLSDCETGEVWLADFSDSEFYGDVKPSGFLPIRAPEHLLGSYAMYPSYDMWSFGALLAKLVFLDTVPEEGSSTDRQIRKIAKMLGTDALFEFMPKSKLEEFLKAQRHPSRMRAFKGVSSKGVNLSKYIDAENKHLVNPEVLDLLNSIFQYNHTKRPSAAQVMQHPYFAGLRA